MFAVLWNDDATGPNTSMLAGTIGIYAGPHVLLLFPDEDNDKDAVPKERKQQAVDMMEEVLVAFKPDEKRKEKDGEEGVTKEMKQQAKEYFDWNRAWYPIAPLDYLHTDKPNPVKLLGKRMVVWCSDVAENIWHAALDSCPHRMAPLSIGEVLDSGELRCRYHGWSFNGAGSCVCVPQARNEAEEARISGLARSCLTTFPVQVKQGLVWIFPFAGQDATTHAKKSAPCVTPEMDGAEWIMTVAPVGYQVSVENTFDPSHAPFLHNGIVKYAAERARAITKFVLRDDVISGKRGFVLQHNGYDESTEGIAATRQFVPPCSNTTVYKYADGRVETNQLYFVPCGPHETRYIVNLGAGERRRRLPTIMEDVLHVLFFNKIFGYRFQEQDLMAMCGQETRTLERALQESSNYAWGEQYVLGTPADKGVEVFRRWFYEFANGGPYFPRSSRTLPATDSMLFDRWQRHSKHCPRCRRVMRAFGTVQGAAGRVSVCGLIASAVFFFLHRREATEAALLATLLSAALGRWAAAERWGFVSSMPLKGLMEVYCSELSFCLAGSADVIHSTWEAFAARNTDGTVVTWGNAAAGGDSSTVSAQLTDVDDISSNGQAFAAKKTDGTVVTWGFSSSGGDSTSVSGQLTDVQVIYSGDALAFAAKKTDGTVVTWGSTGGQHTDVEVVYVGGAFAAKKTDGTIVTWGSTGVGGDSSSVSGQLTDVEVIYFNRFAFAAKKTDGTVVTWGNSGKGGDSSSVSGQLTNVDEIFCSSTGDTFAAKKTDGMPPKPSHALAMPSRISGLYTYATAGSRAAAVMMELERNTDLLVSQLKDGQASITTDSGMMTALRLPAIAANSSYLAITVNSTSAAFALPLEAVGTDYLVVLTVLDMETSDELGGKSQTKAGRPIEAAPLPLVDVTLVDSQTRNAQEVRVAEDTPIYVRIAAVPPEPNWICAYLDGNSWSQEGVHLATMPELERALGANTETYGTWCATSHLSFFGVFVDILLDCTNVNMLTPEGLREIVERHGWWLRPPALALWLLLLALLLLLLLGCHYDARAHRSGLWRDEYFLTDLPPTPTRRRWAPCRTCSHSGITKPERVPAREVSDSEPSTLPQLRSMLQRVKPTLASSFQEHALCRNTLWEAAVCHGLHVNSIEAHIWGRRGWVQGSLATYRSPPMKELAMEMETSLPSAFTKVHTSRAHRVWAALLATHPVYEIFLCDIHTTAAKRAKIIMDCVLGSLCFVALFFSVDGSAVAARSPAECPIEQGAFLWYTFVALFSVLLNFFPRSLECYLARRSFAQVRTLHRRYQLWNRYCKDIGFWMFSIFLSLLHLLVVAAFLANLSEADELKWMFTFTVVLVRKLVIVPLLACLFSSLGTELSMYARSGKPILPSKQMGLEIQISEPGGSEGQATVSAAAEDRKVWFEKVKELAGRALTIRQLLDFYCELGSMHFFDPLNSTTHDVVRQAIIPQSLKLREAGRFFVVTVHRAIGFVPSLGSLFCAVSVRSPEGPHKPWKGGGRTSALKSQEPVWEEAFIVEDVFKEERLHFSIRGEELGSISIEVEAEPFWEGSRAQQLRHPSGALLEVSMMPYASIQQVREAMEKLPLERHRGREHTTRHLTGISPSTSSIASLPGPGCESLDVLREETDLDEHTVVRGGYLPDKLTISASRGLLRGREQAMQPGYAYATMINGGHAHLAAKMVTHSWRNKFTHLMAAILADALDAEKYDEIAQGLVEREFEPLTKALRRKGRLDVRYWVCAFSVNQHTGICASPPLTDSTGNAIMPCTCRTAKHFKGDLSEMNKFDDMMAYMKKSLRRQGKARLEQVVALEVDFSLLTRVWCLAELVEAHELHLLQAIKIHSVAARDLCLHRLAQLDVRDAEASFPADKDLVLSKIDDKDAFNVALQDLVLHRLDSFLQANKASTRAALLDEVLLAGISLAM
ncbi:PAO [Symbiodinium sp. CCMP2592]|nr:PAO [Symbiodinium sp. CCMP2592]